jgi:hypothetical protein
MPSTFMWLDLYAQNMFSVYAYNMFSVTDYARGIQIEADSSKYEIEVVLIKGSLRIDFH